MSAVEQNPNTKTESLPKNKLKGERVNGKSWKIEKPAFNKSLNHTTKKESFKDRKQKQEQERLVKEKLKQLKQEKVDEKKQRIEDIKKRREDKEEKERDERLAQKYHAKKVERLRRKEKRNKLLNDGRKK